MCKLGNRYCLLLLLLAPLLRAGEAPAVEELIRDMFPQATLVGEKTAGDPIPLWPVYQLNELIGYAFESDDMVALPGFSGDTVNLLIGIDTRGTFAGVRLLRHHEPIFIYGLGPQPLLDFIAQYPGHSLAERIVVADKGRHADSANTYFDGITKATVSVVVVGDTIVSAAMKVARAKLAEFAQLPAARVRMELFSPLSAVELQRRGLLRVWHLARPEVAQAIGGDLEGFSDPELDLGGGDGITLYYAYLNPPIIGRNLLGEVYYSELMRQLQPGEHAFAIMSEGIYSYLPSWYQPATAPERITLNQRGLPISLRDLNFFDTRALALAAGMAARDNLRIFGTRAQAGLDPGEPMSLQLRIELQRNHLERRSARFSDDYRLPAALFERVAGNENAAPEPLWLRVWRSRALETGVLCAGLGLLAVAFLCQSRLSRSVRRVNYFRRAFLGFTVLFIGLFAQGQLSVVNVFTLLLALRNGFDLGVFLLDPVLFILWLFTLISLLLFGRGLYCGWLCPFGAIQEGLSWLAVRLRVRQWRVGYTLHRHLLKLKYLVFLALLGLAWHSLQLAEQAAEVEPFKTVLTLGFARAWPFVAYAVLVLALGLFIHKFYCRYLCPLGAGLAVLGRLRRWEWLERRAECGSPCQLCRHRCQIGAIRQNGTVDYDECIQCLECVVILRDPGQCAPALVARRRQAAAGSAPVPVLVQFDPGANEVVDAVGQGQHRGAGPAVNGTLVHPVE
ncbi:MAG: 4Fe-4S binding protein [Parahaliea sp.]